MDILRMDLRSDEEAKEGRAALAAILGDQEAERLAWLSRLVKRDDRFMVKVMNPVTPDLRELPPQLKCFVSDDESRWYNAPWLAPPEVLAVSVREYPLLDGVELLRGPENPEIEIYRRREVTRQNDERIAAAQAAAIEKQRVQEAHDAEQRRLDIEFRATEFYELQPDARILFLVARAIEDGLSGAELAAELRGMAESIGKMGGLRAPRRVWWSE